MLFGKQRDKGIRMNGHRLEVVQLGNGVGESDLLVHDEQDGTLAFLLGAMHSPAFPMPLGVIRAVQRPTYDEAINAQVAQARAKQGEGDLDALFGQGDTWDVP
jgi:2-oxoglutarate ferredoxin oxidoreductase subunit beta